MRFTSRDVRCPSECYSTLLQCILEMSDEEATLLAAPRQNRIREFVLAREEVRVADLAIHFGVTDETIRRDLRLLERTGVLRRVHGGAIPVTPTLDVSFTQRMSTLASEKDAIARAALELLANARTVFIDEGSITVRLARLLAERQGLRILTNMPAVAEAAAPGSHEIELTGGVLDRRDHFLRGEPPLSAIRERLFDVAVMGTSGLDPEHGFLANEGYTAALRRLLVARSRRVVVLAVHTAFGRQASWCATPFSAVHAVVTDRLPAQPFRDAFDAAGTRLLVAGQQQADTDAA